MKNIINISIVIRKKYLQNIFRIFLFISASFYFYFFEGFGYYKYRWWECNWCDWYQ